jgi:hypothetical protein
MATEETPAECAAAENAASRIFLGIHCRFDAIEGISAGDRIADIDFDTQLRPIGGNGPTHVASVNFTAQLDAYLNNTYVDYFSGGGSGGEGGVGCSSFDTGSGSASLLTAVLAGPAKASASLNLSVATNLPPANSSAQGPAEDQGPDAAADPSQTTSDGGQIGKTQQLGSDGTDGNLTVNLSSGLVKGL